MEVAPATDLENRRPATDAPREPSPDGNLFARSSGGADQGHASSGAVDRNMAETWPAAKVGVSSGRAEHRYNLRSSTRRNPAAGASSSLQTEDAADGRGQGATRSRTPTRSKRRDNGSHSRNSSVGKRSRDGCDDSDDAELGAESHSSKRPRTLSTTGLRGRSSSKKTGKKR